MLYARARWPRAFTASVGVRRLAPTQPVYVVGGWLAALLGGAAGAVQLLWAAGSTLGIPASTVEDLGASHHLTNLVCGLLAVAAVAGLLMLVRRWGAGTPYWVPLVATWTGAGTLVAMVGLLVTVEALADPA